MQSVRTGQIVYPRYVPAQAGKVISSQMVLGQEYATIRMLNGKEITKRVWNLKEYADLVEEHHRKYQRHSKILGKLSMMDAPSPRKSGQGGKA